MSNTIEPAGPEFQVDDRCHEVVGLWETTFDGGRGTNCLHGSLGLTKSGEAKIGLTTPHLAAV